MVVLVGTSQSYLILVHISLLVHFFGPQKTPEKMDWSSSSSGTAPRKPQKEQGPSRFRLISKDMDSKESAARASRESVYVLELEQGRYYIGSTWNVDKRFAEHVQGTGSEWTRKFVPLRILTVYEDVGRHFETGLVLEWMQTKGVERVRGGPFCAVDLSPQLLETIRYLLRAGSNSCLECGASDHFAAQCPLKRQPFCRRCGRNNHVESECFAKTTLQGAPLSPPFFGQGVHYQTGQQLGGGQQQLGGGRQSGGGQQQLGGGHQLGGREETRASEYTGQDVQLVTECCTQ